jgi:23S rRNA pseudouridine2605 synthase
MKNEMKPKAKAPTAKRAPKSAAKSEKPEATSKKAGTKTPGAKAGKAKAEAKAAVAKAKKTTAAPAIEVAAKRAPKAGKSDKKATGAKPEKAKTASTKVRSKKAEPADGVAGHRVNEPIVDPIGDTTDGEGRTYTGEAEQLAHAEMEAFRADTTNDAMDPPVGAALEQTDRVAQEEREAGTEPREPGKLERLQKIISQAGIASRRHAEEMITEGRVMVNGQVVTQLGSKADPERDHIRVDGKLLKGAERHRYFMLNKPKGYVTTVSDPEGRSTVMEFFAKTSERLYPVGRLDYQSEGLLLMTNDGELANLLTKAGSGVEKTYLVKVAGQPSEEELERLRGGVEIERGEEGSGRVRTAPARVRQVREGENPWYEVVLIEGRNRELRKMFSAVGHFVEKIRRVGYGPLVLDVEPGKSRELTAEEVNALRLTAERKIKPRRMKVDLVLPKNAGRGAGMRSEGPALQRRDKPAAKRFEAAPRRDGKPFTQRSERPSPARSRFDRPGFERGGSGGGQRRQEFHGGRGSGGFKAGGFEGSVPQSAEFQRGSFKGGETGSSERRGGKPFGVKRPFAGGQRPFGGGRPASGPKPQFDRPAFERPREERGAGKPARFGERPRFEGQRPERSGSRFGEPRPFGGGRSSSGPNPRFEKPRFGGGPREGRSGGATRMPFRPHGERPYFKPGGPPKGRFDNAPGRSFDKGAGKGWTQRPEGRGEGPREASVGPGRTGDAIRGKNWTGKDAKPSAGRPKTGFGSKPSFGSRPGGFAKSNRPGGFKRPNKPGGGARRGGPRFGSKRPGGR